MNSVNKITFLLILAVLCETRGIAQPTNPNNYCPWIPAMLGGPDRYFKNDTAKVCFGSTLSGGRSYTLPNTTYTLDNGFTTYTSDASGLIFLPPVTSAGQHWFDITKDGCTARDSFFILYVTPPIVNLGNDTILCQGDSLLLDAGNTGASFTWNNNFSPNQPQTFVVKQPGKYSVIIYTPGCATKDTIQVDYAATPNFSLGPDRLLCEGDSVMLYPGYLYAKYLWQDGSTKPSFTVSVPGTYSVRIDHACGTFNDTIVFKYSLCKFYIPTAFTPNDDGLNDVFKIAGYDNVSLLRFRVYNRSGAEVFFSSSPDKGWNGLFKGQVQPGGVYVWILEYKKKYSPGVFSQKGTVTLIR